MHITVNNLLAKIDELLYIAKLSEAAVIGISESKLDDSVLSSEIQIENYDLTRSDRNRRDGGVAFFTRYYLSYSRKSFLPSERENVFIEPFCHIQGILIWVEFIVHQVRAVLLK